MFSPLPSLLTALALVITTAKSTPSSWQQNGPAAASIPIPPFTSNRQLLARQISSEECDRVCEGPTKEYYEGKGCSSAESLDICCTDSFISDYVQCNVCRRNNDQDSPDYPGIQNTLNNWGTWCASNGRPVKMAYLPGQSAPTSNPSQQTPSRTSQTQTSTSTVITSTTSVRTSSAALTGISNGTTTVSDPATSIQTSSGGDATGGVDETSLAGGAASGGGAPRPTDQRITEETPGNNAQSMVFAKAWDPWGGSLQKMLVVALTLGAVLM